MATSAVAICNSALIKVGSDRITSLSDVNLRAEVCNEQYAKCRDDLLISHPWNFAVANVELAQDATYDTDDDADAGFQYRYTLPSDVLRVLLLNNDTSAEWRIEGGYLYTDENEAVIKYIKQETDTTLFSKKFEEVLSLRIARDIAYRLTQSVTLVQNLDVQYEKMLKEARSFDAQEGSGISFVSDTWYNSRF